MLGNGDARQAARRLVDNKVSRLCGLGIDDLADTSLMDETVTGIEDALRDGDGEGIKNLLAEIDWNFLEDNEFGY